jgi:hypothetical protein
LPHVLSFTEREANVALRSFLLGMVATGTEVIRGQVNRVPEPRGVDFIVFWPLRRDRLGTTGTDYSDNVVVGSIAGTVLNVTSVVRGVLTPGLTLSGTGAETTLGTQLTGSVGGTGTYAVSPAQTLSATTIYVGERADLAPVDLVVQVDVHGPASWDNVTRLETLFRSDYGVTAFGDVAVTPLYAESPRQAPFVNAEQQYENRWTVDLHLQLSAVVKTPQQFAAKLDSTTIEVEAVFPP